MHSNQPAPSTGKIPEVKDSHPLKPESPAADLNDYRLVPGVCIFLAAITFAVFGQTLGHEFVNYDDNMYVYENPVVSSGLSWKGVKWVFTHSLSANWHPLTMMSHMLDCQWYGLNPGGHHLTNVLLHTASVILLFLVLRRMTGFPWRSAFVAAVFAIHPLRVESVAWVAERKDVLSGLFFMLTLWAYTRYVASDRWQVTRTDSASSRVTQFVSFFYCLVLLFFTLGLMCKSMLVTLPLVLLLLDYWPLGRLSGVKWQVPGEKQGKPSTFNSQLSTLLLEKLPLIGLAVASCVVTIFAQQEALQSFDKFSLPLRMGNALISCAAYLDQMFWPSGLAVLYPLTSGSVGVSGVVLSLVLLAGISTGVFILRRRHPYFLTGWLWYLIMLMPVIGIIQVGGQARADRYTYLPQIGLYLLLTWALAELCAGWRHRRVVLGGGSAIILAVLMICTYEQTSYWRNSESLWTHTLACTSDNDVAHDNFGNFLIGEGRADEAITHYQKAVQINPKNVEAHYNLGNVLIKEGSVDEAITYYQKALQINPDYAQAHNNLGNALLQKGNVDEAIVHFQKALQISPHFAEAHYNFGNVLLHKGRVDEAITHFQTALQIRPDNAEAHYNFGNVLIKAGRVDEAIVQYQQALQINPDSLDFLNNLAWLLATYPDAHIRNGAQAVKYAGRACELTHDGVTLLVGTLAAAYAEAGRYDDAIATAQEACALASASGEQDLLEKNQKLLALYRAHQPYHETAEKFVPAAP